jgi:hypothetical protein
VGPLSSESEGLCPVLDPSYIAEVIAERYVFILLLVYILKHSVLLAQYEL